MVTVVAIDPKENEKFFKTTTEGFEAELMIVDNLGQMPIDDKEIIIFHPRTKDMNPHWLTEEKVEDFNKFDFPEDAYYIFGADFGNIINDIEINAPSFMEKARWVKIPTKHLSWSVSARKSKNPWLRSITIAFGRLPARQASKCTLLSKHNCVLN